MKHGGRSGKSPWRLPARLLIAGLGLYVAAALCEGGAALEKAQRQQEAILQQLQETAQEVKALRQALSETSGPEEIRREAFFRYQMVYPEDVVFFDGG